jgi:hypothetical protein
MRLLVPPGSCTCIMMLVLVLQVLLFCLQCSQDSCLRIERQMEVIAVWFFNCSVLPLL